MSHPLDEDALYHCECGEWHRKYSMNCPKEWTMDQAISTCREVEEAVKGAGWHVALGGSLLFVGNSRHDLDLVFYPHDSTRASLRKLKSVLHAIGWKRTHTAKQTRKHWRKKDSQDQKHVEVWRTPVGKRVDVFVPSVTHE